MPGLRARTRHTYAQLSPLFHRGIHRLIHKELYRWYWLSTSFPQVRCITTTCFFILVYYLTIVIRLANLGAGACVVCPLALRSARPRERRARASGIGGRLTRPGELRASQATHRRWARPLSCAGRHRRLRRSLDIAARAQGPRPGGMRRGRGAAFVRACEFHVRGGDPLAGAVTLAATGHYSRPPARPGA